jgi:membrane protein DedA with SNARE-associated domain
VGDVSGLAAILVAALGALAGLIIAYARGRVVGARLEHAQQAEAEKKARDIADQVDKDIGAMSPFDAREELKRWSRG